MSVKVHQSLVTMKMLAPVQELPHCTRTVFKLRLLSRADSSGNVDRGLELTLTADRFKWQRHLIKIIIIFIM